MFSLHLRLAASLLRLSNDKGRVDFLDDLGLTSKESAQIDAALQDYYKMPRKYPGTAESQELTEYITSWLEEKSEQKLLAIAKPTKGIPLQYNSIENILGVASNG